MSKVNASKITPEQKKFLDSATGTSSITTEQDIRAVGNAQLENILRKQNQEVLDTTSGEIAQDAIAADAFDRPASDTTDPTLQGPTRAQDTYSLRQSPTALMSGVPRMKFEYLAVFRFAGGEDTFDEIFAPGNAEVEALDGRLQEQTLLDVQSGKMTYDEFAAQRNDLKGKRQGVLESIRRELAFNVKQVDGPKVNFQYDTLNQYNRKRNVYRRVDYDPINIRFLDTFNNNAIKLFQYLYELNVRDAQNGHPDYRGTQNRLKNRGLYHANPMISDDTFVGQHNFGLRSFDGGSTYPIKSLDLFIIHGTRYNLIRFVHPKIIAMDHDVFTYEASQPVELGMQFAYETVIYETLNYEMGNAKDVVVDFDQIFQNTLTMPETDYSATGEVEGESGTRETGYDWTRMTTSIPDEYPPGTVGTGSNIMKAEGFINDGEPKDAAFGGRSEFINKFQQDLAAMQADLSKISTTPFSDKINEISSEVYAATKSAVSGFGAGGKSGGGGGIWEGMGDKFSSLKGPGDGRYNPDSKNFRKPVGKGYVKDSKGNLVKDGNGNPVRGGNVYDPRDLNPGRSY